MAESNVVKTYRDGTLTIRDGTSGTAKSYVVTLENGNFTYKPGKHALTMIMDRGEIAGSRKGAKAAGTLSFEIHMRQFADDTDATLIDVIDQTGAWDDAVSVAGAEYEQFLVELEYLSAATVDTEDDQVLTVDKVYLEWDFKEGDQNTIVVNGTIMGEETREG
jgi:hypothetical protein